jgi:hypothetical protein
MKYPWIYTRLHGVTTQTIELLMVNETLKSNELAFVGWFWKLKENIQISVVSRYVRCEADGCSECSLMLSWQPRFTNWLTPWSWVLVDKSPLAHSPKKFSTFYEARRFITVFTRAVHWSLIVSQINPVHTSLSYLSKIHFNIILPYISTYS